MKKNSETLRKRVEAHIQLKKKEATEAAKSLATAAHAHATDLK
jgi:hypothetical protein